MSNISRCFSFSYVGRTQVIVDTSLSLQLAASYAVIASCLSYTQPVSLHTQ